MGIFKKYEMQSQQAAEDLIDALPSATDEEGNTHPTHNHSVVKLGYLTVEAPEFDEEGNVITPGVVSEKYSVDVLWNEAQITETVQDAVYDEEENLVSAAVTEIKYPDGWEECEVQYDEQTWSNPNGAHTFFGWNFN